MFKNVYANDIHESKESCFFAFVVNISMHSMHCKKYTKLNSPLDKLLTNVNIEVFVDSST